MDAPSWAVRGTPTLLAESATMRTEILAYVLWD